MNGGGKYYARWIIRPCFVVFPWKTYGKRRLDSVGSRDHRSWVVSGPSLNHSAAVWRPSWRHMGGLYGVFRCLGASLGRSESNFRTKLRHSILDVILRECFH